MSQNSTLDVQRSKFAEATYLNDIMRSPLYGIMEAGWHSFALIVAIRYFDASETHKAFIAGAGPMGFLLTPLTLYIAASLRARPSMACALIFAVAGILVTGACLASTLLLFTHFWVMSQMVTVQQGPLMLQVFTENYEAEERGARMTVPFMLTAISSIVFAALVGSSWTGRSNSTTKSSLSWHSQPSSLHS